MSIGAEAQRGCRHQSNPWSAYIGRKARKNSVLLEGRGAGKDSAEGGAGREGGGGGTAWPARKRKK
jgi:hypothetical protein